MCLFYSIQHTLVISTTGSTKLLGGLIFPVKFDVSQFIKMKKEEIKHFEGFNAY